MTVTFYIPATDPEASVADDCDANNCFYCTSPETD
jgi:hypothetical protein